MPAREGVGFEDQEGLSPCTHSASQQEQQPRVSISYLQDGRPLEYYLAWHRADRSKFEIEMVVGTNAIGGQRPASAVHANVYG